MSLYIWKAAHAVLVTKKTRVVIPAIFSAIGFVGSYVFRWFRKKVKRVKNEQ